MPLGRRFRALKLWFTIRTGGAAEAVDMIRRHVALTQELAQWVADDERFEIVAPHPLNLVCIRLRAGDAATDALIQRANESGRALFTRTVLDGQGGVPGERRRPHHRAPPRGGRLGTPAVARLTGRAVVASG